MERLIGSFSSAAMLDSFREPHHMPKLTSSGRVRFGVFEIDFVSGELRKRGMKIKLHDQPFKVLAMLVERPGEVITREEFREELWPADTFVDWDLGLNSAVMKLRAALGDSAESPRFVETLPRRGYRWIAPVEPIGAPHDEDQRGPSREDSPDAVSAGPETAQVALPERADLLDAEPVPSETVLSAGPAEEPARRGVSGWLRTALLATVLAAIGFGLWRWLGPAGEGGLPQPRYVIAVLPLKNLSSEPEGDYFSDGLTDELISDLSVIDGLQVKSQTSSFAFRDKPLDIRTVGSQLGANLILEGSVLRAGERLRVNVQLVRASDDYPLWSGRYERELKDIFAVQDEISLSIVNELRLNLGQGRRRYNTDLETYDLYLKALASKNQNPGGDKVNIAASIPLFEAVIARDPNFAPAYAGIADAYAYLSTSPRGFSPEEAYAKMRPACERALALDPLLAEAYACMGLLNSRDSKWSQAESDFRKTFQLNPSLSRPHSDYAMTVLYPMGKLTEAERQVRMAIQLDPLSAPLNNALNMILLSERKYDEVLANCRPILAANPDDRFTMQIYARALMQKGRVAEAIPILENAGKGSESFLGYAYAKDGRRADAEQIAAQHKDWPWMQAIVSAGLGDKEGTLAGLQGMAAIKDSRFGMYPQYPELALVLGDPRLTEMRKALSLPAIH
jgi:TolB-like protein/DNA-binding winged helix-turn-helix (wHTH) protein/Flp pilus assembly protein TadD